MKWNIKDLRKSSLSCNLLPLFARCVQAAWMEAEIIRNALFDDVSGNQPQVREGSRESLVAMMDGQPGFENTERHPFNYLILHITGEQSGLG